MSRMAPCAKCNFYITGFCLRYLGISIDCKFPIIGITLSLFTKLVPGLLESLPFSIVSSTILPLPLPIYCDSVKLTCLNENEQLVGNKGNLHWLDLEQIVVGNKSVSSMKNGEAYFCS